MKKLKGRNAIVTGASEGLGFEIARTFVAEGANVAICARNPDRLEDARVSLSEGKGGELIVAHPCDVSSDVQVRLLIDLCVKIFGRIDILINNAGILGPIGKTEDVDLEQWKQTLETNVYGVLNPVRALLPHMRANAYGKIVNLSGGGATSPRPFFSAYASAKAAIVRLTENLAVELYGAGIDVNAVAPGALNTRMLLQTLAAGRESMQDSEFEKAQRQKEAGGSSIKRASELCAYLASTESDGITGRLISASWDPWPFLPDQANQLASSDIFTLRRIVPEDRGQRWGDHD